MRAASWPEALRGASILAGPLLEVKNDGGSGLFFARLCSGEADGTGAEAKVTRPKQAEALCSHRPVVLCWRVVVLLALFYIGLFMQLGEQQPAAPGSELDIRRKEARLLHLGIDRAALHTLLVWDEKTNALRDGIRAEDPDDSTPLMILHLWATWCEPCKVELPLWREMGPQIAEKHHNRVRIVHVALQNDSSDMAGFVRALHKKLPFPLKHFDRGEHLAAILRGRTPNGKLTLPMTLLLDQDRVVRQAFIGPIGPRRQELQDATAWLLSRVDEREAEALRPKPKDKDNDDVFDTPN